MTIEDVLFTPLRVIPTAGGDVRHALKASAPGFTGFGEAYFSTVQTGTVKGWKKHTRMTLNLVVPRGEIRFVIQDETAERQWVYHLTPDRSGCYGRLTIRPGLWVAFGGVGEGLNLLLNIADIEHDPAEAQSCDLQSRTWSWSP
jgi:dTDP-4-dehydrorhamnose 3,5-epimerase